MQNKFSPISNDSKSDDMVFTDEDTSTANDKEYLSPYLIAEAICNFEYEYEKDQKFRMLLETISDLRLYFTVDFYFKSQYGPEKVGSVYDQWYEIRNPGFSIVYSHFDNFEIHNSIINETILWFKVDCEPEISNDMPDIHAIYYYFRENWGELISRYNTITKAFYNLSDRIETNFFDNIRSSEHLSHTR